MIWAISFSIAAIVIGGKVADFMSPMFYVISMASSAMTVLMAWQLWMTGSVQ